MIGNLLRSGCLILYEVLAKKAMIVQNVTSTFLTYDSWTYILERIKSRARLIEMPPDQLSPKYQSYGSLSVELAKEKIQQAAEGEPVLFERLHETRDGTPFSALVSLSPLFLKNPPGFGNSEIYFLSQTDRREQPDPPAVMIISFFRPVTVKKPSSSHEHSCNPQTAYTLHF
jgi:hypothetical protein